MIWVEAARPKTLIASFSPVLIGNVITYREASWSPLTLLSTLVAALAIQVGTNYVNDYADALSGRDTPLRQGPRRLTSSLCVSVASMKRAAFLAFSLAALSSCFLVLVGGYPIALLAILSIFLGYLYSLSRFSLSATGTADLFVLLFFGVLATGFSAYLQTGLYLKEAFIAGLAPGALSLAILTVNNLRDYEEDLSTNKKTLVVRLGKKAGRIEYLICIYLAILTPMFLSKQHPAVILASLGLLAALPLIKQVFRSENLPQVLSKTGFFLFVYTFLFVIGWLL